MNGHSRHPGIEELAEFRAGVTDAADGRRLAAHLAECPDCASLGERIGQVPALLASIPAPAMPDDIETRILGALAAEAAASPRSSRSWWRSRTAASLGGLIAAAACAVLAFAGYQLSGAGQPTSNSSASGGAMHSGSSGPVSGSGAPMRPNTFDSPAGVPSTGAPSAGSPSFTVVASGPNLLPSKLQAQIMQQLPRGGAGKSGAAASQSLVGCVTRLLGPATPVLVEQARYQSRPAYVVAESSRAWVVGRGCTAADPQVLASVALPTASGG